MKHNIEHGKIVHIQINIIKVKPVFQFRIVDTIVNKRTGGHVLMINVTPSKIFLLFTAIWNSGILMWDDVFATTVATGYNIHSRHYTFISRNMKRGCFDNRFLTHSSHVFHKHATHGAIGYK